jgi:hypothetical protein
MAKSKKSKAKAEKPTETTLAHSTVAELRADRDLWYRICVLIYDLRNLAKDNNAENRILCTTDELYISTPYFSSDEAARIKVAMIESTLPYPTPPSELEGWADELDELPPPPQATSIEHAITISLANFFEKRRASGDPRPCGPHDMAPIYQRVFGVDRTKIEDERFLSRLRRSGLAT